MSAIMVGMHRIRLIAAALGLGVLLSACQAQADVTATPSPTGFQWHNPMVGNAGSKPEIVLTDQTGASYSLAQRTKGKVTVLYFGYTNCPDACPATMATLTLAVRQLPADVRSQVAVVFVTTDPVRDTPAVLASWLSKFDVSFVGLTEVGVDDRTDALIVQAQVNAHIPAATNESPEPGGAYGVNHAAYALVYTPDGIAHLGFFSSNTTAAGEAADLQELVTRGWH